MYSYLGCVFVVMTISLVNASPLENQDLEINNQNAIKVDGETNSSGTSQQCQVMGATPPKPASGCCGRQVSTVNALDDATSRTQDNFIDLDEDSELPRSRRSTENKSFILPAKNIYDGETPELDQFPWVVRILFNSSVVIFENSTHWKYGRVTLKQCGGALVSSRYVLTAGHCIHEPTRSEQINIIEVVVGEYDIRNKTNCVKKDGSTKCSTSLTFRAEAVRHPEYVQYSSKYLVPNDIGILKLSEDVPYTEYIRPICLPTSDINDDFYNGAPLLFSGWGETKLKTLTKVKQFSVVTLVTKEKCSTQINSILDDRMVCASGHRNLLACPGDSGGPLMMYKDGQYSIVGILSISHRICDGINPKFPDVYMNVFRYLEWIQNNIRSHDA